MNEHPALQKTNRDPMRIALLISGTGSAACRIITDARAGVLPVHVACLVASRETAVGIENAIRAGLEPGQVHIINPKLHRNPTDSFGEALTSVFAQREINLFVQAGWLPQTPASVLARYQGINLHPAGLDPGYPDFGGKGMYGRAAIDAVRRFAILRGGDLTIETSVHTVGEKIDQGKILGIRSMRFAAKATTEQIQNALRPREHDNIVSVLGVLAHCHLVGEIPSMNIPGITKNGTRSRRLIDPTQASVLQRAKDAAIAAYPNG